jgi:hypothetical protein
VSDAMLGGPGGLDEDGEIEVATPEKAAGS